MSKRRTKEENKAAGRWVVGEGTTAVGQPCCSHWKGLATAAGHLGDDQSWLAVAITARVLFLARLYSFLRTCFWDFWGVHLAIFKLV